MGLGEAVVDFKSFRRRGPRFRVRLPGRGYTPGAEDGVGAGQPGIGQGIAGVFFNRLIEIVDASLKRLLGSLLPEVSALEIKLIGLWVFRVAFRQPLLLLAAQPRPEL